MTRDPSQDTGHTLHVCSQPVIWSCSVQCVGLERRGPWPKATERPIPPSACSAQAGGPPIQGPRGHPTRRGRAHLRPLAALNHSPLPASSCQGLGAAWGRTAAPPAPQPSLLRHTRPPRSLGLSLFPQGQLWTPTPHGLSTRGTGATARHRRTDQSQRTKHDDNDEIKGAQPSAPGVQVVLCREGRRQERKERRGESKGTGLPSSPCA